MGNITGRIIGTGHFLPERRLTNADLEKLCDTSDDWIRKRTGIEERRMADGADGTADMGTRAAREALSDAGIGPEELDLIICGTLTPQYLLPSTASVIQGELGATQAAAYDVNAACSGFMYGLATANAFIKSGAFRTILLIGTELQTQLLTWKNRDTSVLFADGAAAVVLRASENGRGILTTYLRSDGTQYQLLYVPKGGSKEPINEVNIHDDPYTIVMNGRELFVRAVKSFEEACRKVLDDTGLTVDDVDLFIPHQANARIIEAACERLALPREKAFININKLGNTTHASIPLALHQAREQGRVNDGANLLLASFGGGLSWASAVIKW